MQFLNVNLCKSLIASEKKAFFRDGSNSHDIRKHNMFFFNVWTTNQLNQCLESFYDLSRM